MFVKIPSQVIVSGTSDQTRIEMHREQSHSRNQHNRLRLHSGTFKISPSFPNLLSHPGTRLHLIVILRSSVIPPSSLQCLVILSI